MRCILKIILGISVTYFFVHETSEISTSINILIIRFAFSLTQILAQSHIGIVKIWCLPLVMLLLHRLKIVNGPRFSSSFKIQALIVIPLKLLERI